MRGYRVAVMITPPLPFEPTSRTAGSSPRTHYSAVSGLEGTGIVLSVAPEVA
jgi:hypothetical protein